ncbi:MAG TPA: hypothetical protein ENK60_02135 [Anaerolineae bacterium]|nr:hypothetical protein [Anaerolineae bacterium]
MTDTLYRCLNCQRTEDQIPLISLRYDGKSAWICSQCMPVLIHHPAQLAGKLRNAASIPPAPHAHD